MRVAGYVRKRLAGDLDQLSGGVAELGGDPSVDVDHGDNLALLLKLLGQLAQRLVQLAVGENPGAQPEDVVAQVADGRVDALDGPGEPSADGLRVVDLPLRRLQRHAHGEECLDDAVVQLLCDPLPVFEDCQPLQFFAQARILESDSCLGSEQFHHLQAFPSEGRAATLVGDDQRPEGAPGHAKRHTKCGTEAARNRSRLMRPGVALDVGHVDRVAGSERFACQRFAFRHPHADERVGPLAIRDSHYEHLSTRLRHHHHRLVGPA